MSDSNDPPLSLIAEKPIDRRASLVLSFHDKDDDIVYPPLQYSDILSDTMSDSNDPPLSLIAEKPIDRGASLVLSSHDKDLDNMFPHCSYLPTTQSIVWVDETNPPLLPVVADISFNSKVKSVLLWCKKIK
jgi:hypothetical protein